MSADVLSKALFFSLQGVDSAILASQPFLLITKPTEENRTHPPRSFYTCFFCVCCASSGAKTQMKQTQHLQRISAWLSNLLSSESNGKHSRFGVCSPVALRNILSHSTSSAEPLFPDSLWFYLYVFPYHCCTSLLHWCGSKWPKATGFTMDTRSGATMQNRASS